MTYKIKEIGHVEKFKHGYLAHVYRYGNGRRLPEPRMLCMLDAGEPKFFTSLLDALNALALWKSSPRDCHHVAKRTKRNQD